MAGTASNPQQNVAQQPAGHFHQTANGGAKTEVAPSTGGWSVHQLRRPAVAMAENSPKKQKREVQSPSKLPFEKRPRPSADMGQGADNAIGAWPDAASSSAVPVQRPSPSSGTTSSLCSQSRRSSGASSRAGNQAVPVRFTTDSRSSAPASSFRHPRQHSGASSRPAVPAGSMRGSPSPEPVDEETQERRRAHRQSGVHSVRRSPDYLFLAALWDQQRVIGPPAAPHGTDDVIAVSKRVWEKGMQDWRHEVRRLAVQHGYVPREDGDAPVEQFQ